MKHFKLSLEDGQDIREIWVYIAPDSVRAARKVRRISGARDVEPLL
jgi:plasmid stabilization system protein ParE